MKKLLICLICIYIMVVLVGCNAETQSSFMGVITEINEGYIIIAHDEGEEMSNSDNVISITIPESNDTKFNIGDIIRASYTGNIEECRNLRVELIESKKTLDDIIIIKGEMTHKYISSDDINIIEFKLCIFENYHPEVENNQKITSVMGDIYDGDKFIKKIDFEKREEYTSKLKTREDFAVSVKDFLIKNSDSFEIDDDVTQSIDYYEGEIKIEGTRFSDPYIEISIGNNLSKVHSYILNNNGIIKKEE